MIKGKNSLKTMGASISAEMQDWDWRVGSSKETHCALVVDRWCNVAMADHSVDETVNFMREVVKAHERREKKEKY